ncbi:MAG TPA: lipoate-protein ligase B [Alphaproteobacteria bacterium]|nr:lipoate-protein ligase B [Alphaproteobacteria bacterium]
MIDGPVEWRITQGLTEYPGALRWMEARVAQIADGKATECVWLLEHPPIFTAGTSAKAQDLLTPRFPVYDTGRGGQYTYHGPGQRVAYVMLDLRRTAGDVRRFVGLLEQWVIATLADFNVQAERRDGRVGLWIPARTGSLSENKIAAIGIRVRRWVSYHGISINVSPDLSHFDGIVPCGIRDHGVTSLEALGLTTTMADLDVALRRAFEEVFQQPTKLTVLDGE